MTSPQQAQEMLDSVRDGKTLYTKSPRCWMVVGPAADIKEGASIIVHRRNGSTCRVRITRVDLTNTIQGVTYSTADFEEIPPTLEDYAVERKAWIESQSAQPASPRQVEHILSLLAKRRRTGELGGFFTGPTTREGIEKMNKLDASTYMTSLRGDY